MATTQSKRFIRAPRAAVYRALLDADAVRQWMVPDGMTSEIHSFDGRQGGTFRIVGATWFGGSFNAQTGNSVFTDTDHFQILGPTGPVASVQQTFHIGANGTVTLDKGTCEPPSD